MGWKDGVDGWVEEEEEAEGGDRRRAGVGEERWSWRAGGRWRERRGKAGGAAGAGR